MTSIVDRRKVAGVLAILIFFVVVVTMNHFLYLENATHKLPAKTRALDAQPLDDVLLKDEEQVSGDDTYVDNDAAGARKLQVSEAGDDGARGDRQQHEGQAP